MGYVGTCELITYMLFQRRQGMTPEGIVRKACELEWYAPRDELETSVPRILEDFTKTNHTGGKPPILLKEGNIYRFRLLKKQKPDFTLDQITWQTLLGPGSIERMCNEAIGLPEWKHRNYLNAENIPTGTHLYCKLLCEITLLTGIWGPSDVINELISQQRDKYYEQKEAFELARERRLARRGAATQPQ